MTTLSGDHRLGRKLPSSCEYRQSGLSIRLVVVILWLLASAARPAVAQGSSFHVWMETNFRNQLGSSVAGYAWVVMQHGAVLSEGGGGVTRIDSTGTAGPPMTSHTRMQIASTSKPITATALLHLANERRISLDTPVVSLIGDFAPRPGRGVERITLRHLLQHRSGYPFGYVWPPRAENLRALLARDLPNSPGEVARYSNINYSLARTVIEEISGQPYLEYVRERFLVPSGVHDATLENRPGDAFAHRFADPVRGAELVWDFNDDAGGYGWYMSAMDLARWGQALVEGRLVPPELLQQAFTDSLGWAPSSTVRGAGYTHQGQWIVGSQNMGVRTSIALLPNGIVGVLFLNTNVPYSPTGLLLRAFNAAVPMLHVESDEGQARATVHITIPYPAAEVRYTIDGGEPTPDSPRYERPVTVPLPSRIRARAFLGGERWGFEAAMALQSEEPGEW